MEKKYKKIDKMPMGGKKMKGQDGLVNSDAGGQPAQPQQQQQQGGGISVDVTLTVNSNGQSQPLGNMSIKQPDDIKKLVQMIAGVFQQGGGQQQEQPSQ